MFFSLHDISIWTGMMQRQSVKVSTLAWLLYIREMNTISYIVGLKKARPIIWLHNLTCPLGLDLGLDFDLDLSYTMVTEDCIQPSNQAHKVPNFGEGPTKNFRDIKRPYVFFEFFSEISKKHHGDEVVFFAHVWKLKFLIQNEGAYYNEEWKIRVSS